MCIRDRHGEMHTFKKFYELDANTRPKEKDCIFLSSHEPCSMCLSAITSVSYTHLRAHETSQDLVCRLLLEKKINIIIRLIADFNFDISLN